MRCLLFQFSHNIGDKGVDGLILIAEDRYVVVPALPRRSVLGSVGVDPDLNIAAIKLTVDEGLAVLHDPSFQESVSVKLERLP